MIQLKPVEFSHIQHWFVDYQKKARNFEMPPEEGRCLGIFRGDDLIGYFILITYGPTLVINQGYLKPEARHKNLSRISMGLLEEKAKALGIKKIVLETSRAVNSYIKFMHSMNYEVAKTLFSKEI